MILHDLEQGSPEWHEARLGIPTASEFSKILTATGGKSKQAKDFASKLLAEFITGEAVQTFQKTEWMERGNELEQEAADAYSMVNDVDLEVVGFCTNDEETYGCSPDRLVGKDGMVEIKCVAPHTQVRHLIDDHKVDTANYVQIQGQMLVTGRKWCDWVSYCPKMPLVVVRMERDEEYLEKLEQALTDFNAKIEATKVQFKEKKYI